MHISILIPHYKSKITLYCISQILKYKGNHKVDICVVDNSRPEHDMPLFLPYLDKIKYFSYPTHKIQSHGIAFDFVIPEINTEYFITLESDSYPTNDKWLDYYENLINSNVDCGGSLFHLSGGTYLHPCAAFYKKSNWEQAKEYWSKECQYKYFPNIAMKEGFASHLMVHESILESFWGNPEDYIELSDSYKPYTKENALQKLDYYSPVGNGVFHNGMGKFQESVNTYGRRNIITGKEDLKIDNRAKLIFRVGYEPGQSFHYWHLTNDKNWYYIPTEIKWMEGMKGQQQEYTINEAGVKHLWAGSSYLDMKGTSMDNVYQFKNNQIQELLNQL